MTPLKWRGQGGLMTRFLEVRRSRNKNVRALGVSSSSKSVSTGMRTGVEVELGTETVSEWGGGCLCPQQGEGAGVISGGMCFSFRRERERGLKAAVRRSK